ncbi:MAG: GTP cyclohydrolase I FolE [Candidatus Dasytiphilus stammeri]
MSNIQLCKEKAARQAVVDILNYIGEDVNRQGLIETPDRFLKSLKAQTKGYSEDPSKILEKFFEEVEGYNNLVLLQNIHFESTCEHHLAPIVGSAMVGYIPDKKVVGLSKLARVVDVFSKRLQIQERLTSQIGQTLDEVLTPQGVGVIIRARHNCLCTRGAYKPNAFMTTSYFSGIFEQNLIKKEEFYKSVSLPWGKGVHYSQ